MFAIQVCLGLKYMFRVEYSIPIVPVCIFTVLDIKKIRNVKLFQDLIEHIKIPHLSPQLWFLLWSEPSDDICLGTISGSHSTICPSSSARWFVDRFNVINVIILSLSLNIFFSRRLQLVRVTVSRATTIPFEIYHVWHWILSVSMATSALSPS